MRLFQDSWASFADKGNVTIASRWLLLFRVCRLSLPLLNFFLSLNLRRTHKLLGQLFILTDNISSHRNSFPLFIQLINTDHCIYCVLRTMGGYMEATILSSQRTSIGETRICTWILKGYDEEECICVQEDDTDTLLNGKWAYNGAKDKGNVMREG